MRAIWKWQFYVRDETHIEVPKGTKLLRRANAQEHDVIEVWGIVPHTEAEKVEMLIRVCGTGRPLPPVGWTWVDTVIAPQDIVWHIFTLPQNVAT